MDYKYIEQLMERYWRCETSLQEEEILRSFFSQEDVPANLLPYKELFSYEQTEKATETLGEDFDKKILGMINEDHPVKARVITMRQRLMPLFKAAAVVAIILTLQNALQGALTDEQAAQQPTMTPIENTANKGAAVAKVDSAKIDSAQQAQAIAPSDVN